LVAVNGHDGGLVRDLSAASRALVVGASAGIGRAAAVRLAGLGYTVVAVGRREDRLAQLAQFAGSTAVHAVRADVSDPAQCEELVEKAVGVLGEIDLLLYTASASRLALLRDVDSAGWSAILATNVVGPALVVRACLGHLSPGSVSCLVSSESVGDPFPGIGPYAVSKAGLEELVRGLRCEHPELRFCCLRVGATMGTDFARDFDPDLVERLFPRWMGAGKIPSQLMDAGELGAAVAELLDVAVRSPRLDLQDVVIRAPGGPASVRKTGPPVRR
jgi:NAD(P)-dependent dehydrogenase (short-subunit alcohol dehydrogenase family)